MALPVQGPPPWPPSLESIHPRASSSRHPSPTPPIQTDSLSPRQLPSPKPPCASSQASGPRRRSSESTRSSARCWCGGERERRRRGTGSAGALSSSAARAAGVVGLAAGWATGASATPAGHLTPRQREKARAIDDPLRPTPAPSPLLTIPISPPSHAAGPTPPLTAPVLQRPQPTLRKRLLPKYQYESRSWVINRSWTLRGSVANQGTTRIAATAMEDNVYSLLYSSSASADASSTRPGADASATRTPAQRPTNAQRNSAPSKAVLIPSGWQATPRETNYYAVPIIIAMSVLVAVVVVGAILGSVFWRRKKRRRRDVEKDAMVQEKGWRGIMQKVVRQSGGQRKGRKKSKRKARAVEEHSAAVALGADAANEARSVQDSVGSGGSAGGSGVRHVRTLGFAAGNRVQPRRRRRRAQGGDEGGAGTDDESAALTRTGSRSTISSATPNDTLTARLARQLRRSNRTEIETGGLSTAFSDALAAGSRSTLSADVLSELSRSSTRTSTRSSLGPPPSTRQPPQLFFTPADDPALQPLAPSLSAHSLSRTTSRTSSIHSVARVPVPSPALESLPLPAAPLATTSAAFNALLCADADLALPLAPGPPAYRPSSSTVQTTRRFGAGDLPVPAGGGAVGDAAGRVVGRGRRRARQPQRAEEEDEGEWHWPGEKGRGVAGFGGASTSAAGSSADPSTQEDEPAAAASPFDEGEVEDEPPLDPSMYTAHLATDDKAILARLRNAAFRATGVDEEYDGTEDGPPAAYAEAGPSAQPSAPPVEEFEDGEVDEDGYERLVPQAEEGQGDEDGEANIGTSTTAVPPSPSLLPAPPSRVLFSYPYLSSSTPSSSHPPSSTSTTLAPPPSPASASPAPTSSASTSKSALAAEYAALSAGQERDEDEFELPVYLPRAGNEALGMASAPPVLEGDDDDDDEEDEDDGDEEKYSARRTPEA
ncbi:hypothetical protein JCM21900_000353 [Sporobolomyces salmonicolor]